ncbi:hypothetical protein B0H14DRAFT_2659268 [Mycena olivaceomarginata]|nr:hypothetical protein B0H14DRAFT_2659268 [Mycena olivaceomarginata]
MPTNAKATCSLRGNKPNRRVLVGGHYQNSGPRSSAAAASPHKPSSYRRDEWATAMSEERRLKFVALQTGEGFSEGTDGGDFEDQAMDIDDVLRGDVQFDISNAGGEFEEEVGEHESGQDEYGADRWERRHLQTYSGRRQYVLNGRGQRQYIVSVPLQATDEFIVSSLVGQGPLPLLSLCNRRSQLPPRVLEMAIRTISCPAVLNLLRPLSRNLSQRRQGVVVELKRERLSWHLRIAARHAPTAGGGDEVNFLQAYAMDGNDSLKRVLCNGQTFDKRKTPPGVKHIDDPEEQTSGVRSGGGELKEDMTSRMWGIFDETGQNIPLAIVDALLDAFGPNIGGYDIGCGFGKTINKSPLGKKAQTNSFRCLVGSFHATPIIASAQLSFLATYVPGMGLEDLEGCERFFSKSNALARSTQYASIFHQRQTITAYLAHTDVYDTYANLSTFLVNNYKQAIEILETEEPTLAAIKESGIQDVSEFQSRLKEEMEYLRGLSKEPDEETDRLEYYRRLVALMEWEEKFNTRWEWESAEWLEAEELANTRKYRKCINKLEALVLKRMFELTKMNLSGTGYKMRKHIAKALQAMSQAIRNALKRYNTAASALDRRTLSWHRGQTWEHMS